jgi:hypothetical protein
VPEVCNLVALQEHVFQRRNNKSEQPVKVTRSYFIGLDQIDLLLAAPSTPSASLLRPGRALLPACPAASDDPLFGVAFLAPPVGPVDLSASTPAPFSC